MTSKNKKCPIQYFFMIQLLIRLLICGFKFISSKYYFSTLTRYKGLIEILVTFCNDLHVISRKPRKPRNTREFFEICGTKYSRMDQVKFVEDSPWKFEGVWSARNRPCTFKFFKGCLPQFLFGLFLNTLSHIFVVGIQLLLSFRRL